MGDCWARVPDSGGGRLIGEAGGWRTVIPAGERGVSLVSGVAIMTGPALAGCQPSLKTRWAAILRRLAGL
jgi:hypothetical protein